MNNQCQPYWTALYKSLEDCEKLFSIEWGQMEGIPAKKEDPNAKPDVIRKHEPQGVDVDKVGVMTSKGAASTTKQIVENSVASRQKLLGFDNVLK